MSDPPTVLCLQYTSSKRGYRFARLLKQNGFDPILAQFSKGESVRFSSDDEHFKSIDLSSPEWYKLFSFGPVSYPFFKHILGRRKGDMISSLLLSMYPHGMKKVVEELGRRYEIDYVHVLGFPDGQIIPTKEVFKVPVAFDFRDVPTGLSDATLARNFRFPLFPQTGLDLKLGRYQGKKWMEHELYALSRSDGVSFVSNEMRTMIVGHHDHEPGISEIIENRPFKKDLPSSRMRKLSDTNGMINVVYTGGIDIEGYRNYIDIFRKLIGSRCSLHIYTTSSDRIKREYESKLSKKGRIEFHDPIPYGELMYEISQYDYGIIPFLPGEDIDHLDIAIPNKFYEYLGSGLRLIATPLATMRRLIGELECGVLLDDVVNFESTLIDDFETTGGKLLQKDDLVFCQESQMDGVKRFFKMVFSR